PRDHQPRPATVGASPAAVDACQHLETEARHRTIIAPPDPAHRSSRLLENSEKCRGWFFSLETISAAVRCKTGRHELLSL
ncbi:hypothetical protein TorRG33x02_118270, partial [Trema orientale]